MIKTVDSRLGHQTDEVVVSRLVERMEAKMVSDFVLVLLAVVVVYDVSLAAENRFYRRERTVDFILFRPALFMKRLQREKVAVIRHGNSGHTPFPCPFYERHQLALSVEKRIRGMKMKMDKIRHIEMTIIPFPVSLLYKKR